MLPALHEKPLPNLCVRIVQHSVTKQPPPDHGLHLDNAPVPCGVIVLATRVAALQLLSWQPQTFIVLSFFSS